MSEAKPLPRPRQVTVAGWAVVMAAVLLLLNVFDRMSSLRSLESRESAAEFLDSPAGRSFGVGLETYLGWIHAALLVAGAGAVAAAILGYFALERHRGARVGLTVVALPLLISSGALPVDGQLMASIVVAAVLALWLQPAADWFAGREPRPVAPEAPSAQRPSVPAHGVEDRPVERDDVPPLDAPGAPGVRTVAPWGTPPTAGVPQEPRPYEGFGTTPTHPGQPGQAPYGQAPYDQGPYGQEQRPAPYDPHAWPQSPARPQRGPRPGAVLLAALLTWLFSGLTLGLTAVSIAVFASDNDLILDEVRRTNPEIFEQPGVSEQFVMNLTYVMAGVMVVWALAAIVLAALALRGLGWARIMLIVSAVATAGFCLLGALGNPALLLPMLAAAATVQALMRREVRAWYAARP